MKPDRLNALTDGVVAIVLTIMVLEVKVPAEPTLSAVLAVLPLLAAYLLAFIYVAIYWNNHHHYFHLVRKVNGPVMWANFNLLFWLSLVPFATGWMGEHAFAPMPTAVYGVSLLMPALAWRILQGVVIRNEGPGSPMKAYVGNDAKGLISTVIYATGIALSFVAAWAALLCYAAVALTWLVPDKRIERMVEHG
jgi:uncharacterized membrane protein